MPLPAGLRRLASYASLTPDDLAVLGSVAGTTRELARGDLLLREGDPEPSLYLLLDGWTASSMTVADGSRQMIRVELPGDVIGLPSLSVTQVPDTVTALTRAVVSKLSIGAFGELFTQSPKLAAVLFLVSQQERVLLMDRLTSLGRVSVPGRLAGLILQLQDRLEWHNSVPDDTISLPLTQEDLADLVGTSHVHLSRIMASFRREELISYGRRSLTILNKEKLRELAALPRRVPRKNQKWIPGNTSADSADD